ncbi:MAG: sel1 repeat family protein [Holosporales bacterium]|jgi:TPR repeat protein|nr:sel1 repeat family protein [Holosporales bacterium]
MNRILIAMASVLGCGLIDACDWLTHDEVVEFADFLMYSDEEHEFETIEDACNFVVTRLATRANLVDVYGRDEACEIGSAALTRGGVIIARIGGLILAHLVAEHGHINAFIPLGNYYCAMSGAESERFREQGILLFQAAYDAHIPEALIPWGQKSEDEGISIDCFTEAAEEHGFKEGAQGIVQILLARENKPWEDIEHWSIRASELGSSSEIIYLASLFERGVGVGQNYAHAAHLLQRTAPFTGEAAFLLGEHLLEGRGVNQDFVQAAEMFHQAADKYHHPRAEYFYGACLARGIGVPSNEVLGVFYLTRAATRGDLDAQCDLAQLMLTGTIIPQEIEGAISYYRDAADHWHTEAACSLMELADSQETLLEKQAYYCQVGAGAGGTINDLATAVLQRPLSEDELMTIALFGVATAQRKYGQLLINQGDDASVVMGRGFLALADINPHQVVFNFSNRPLRLSPFLRVG